MFTSTSRQPRSPAAARFAGALLGVATLVAGAPVSAGEDAGAPQGPASPIAERPVHTPPREAPVYTPLPLYVELPDAHPASRVVVRYKPYGATKVRSLEMPTMGRGFGVLLTCEELTTTGPLGYYLTFFDDRNRPAGSLGSPAVPFVVTIVDEVDGEAPRLPGQPPPPRCLESITDPPCIFDGSECARPSGPVWPYPLPSARRGGCAGCSSAASSPGGFPLGLVGLAIAAARALRRVRAGRRARSA